MQFQVPQFIETEDKVVGPLSIRQFIYVGIAGIISAMFYFLVATWVFVIAAIILFALAIGVSFVKIEGRPLIDVIRSAIGFYWKPQTYVWQPEHPVINMHQPKKPAGKPIAAPPPKDIADGAAQRKKWEEQKAKADAGGGDSLLQKVLSGGGALHKKWENLQTGKPFEGGGGKQSSSQFLEKKMEERYQIFQKLAGDREAARRVDYR